MGDDGLLELNFNGAPLFVYNKGITQLFKEMRRIEDSNIDAAEKRRKMDNLQTKINDQKSSSIMTANISPIKKTRDAPLSEPKREELSKVDVRISELLKNSQKVKHNRDLLIAWHEIGQRPIPKVLQNAVQSQKTVIPPQPGDNCLHLAIKMRDYELIKGVLKAKMADPREPNSQGLDALKLVLQVRVLKIQYLFLKKGVRDADGNTILHLQFAHPIHEGKFPPDFSQFESAKPDLTLENSHGKTCYELAADNFYRKSFRQMMAYMEEQGQTIPLNKNLIESVSSYRMPPKSFELTDLTFQKVLNFLSLQDLTTFERVNHHARKHTRPLYIERIRRYGYPAKDHLTAKRGFKELLDEVKDLKSKDPKRKVCLADLGFSFTPVTTLLEIFHHMHALPTSQIFKLLSCERTMYWRKNKLESPFLSIFKLESSWEGATANPEVEDKDNGILAVRNTILYGHMDILGRLLTKRASLDAYRGDPPLFCAISPPYRLSDHVVNVVALLLEHKADVNEESWPYGTPLIKTINKYGDNKIDLIKLLLDGKADPNLRGLDSPSPLALAKAKGKVEVAELLIAYGAIE